MNPRILELAKECGFSNFGFPGWVDRRFERFYCLAHQDGQRAMRERAAEVVKYRPEFVAAIRNLEITP